MNLLWSNFLPLVVLYPWECAGCDHDLHSTPAYQQKMPAGSHVSTICPKSCDACVINKATTGTVTKSASMGSTPITQPSGLLNIAPPPLVVWPEIYRFTGTVQWTNGDYTHEHMPGDFEKTKVTCVLCCLPCR